MFDNSNYLIEPIRIEISATCNAICTYCPTGANKKQDYMSPEKFEDIIKHLLKTKIVNISNLIGIFNRSEPFTNPKVSEIIDILAKHKLKARIGSNFIKYPDLTPEGLSCIQHVSFSLNSLKPEIYKSIYGVNLQKVLNNFDRFLKDIKKHNPSCKVVVHWISYSYNKDEEDGAKKYFRNRGVIFHPISATMLDYGRIFDLLDNPDETKLNIIEKDFPIRKQLSAMRLSKKKEFKRYHCKFFDALCVDIDGEVLTCTYIREDNKDYRSGKNIFEIDRDWILNKSINKDVCKKCLSYMVTDSIFANNSVESLFSIVNILTNLIDKYKDKDFILYGFGAIGEVILGELIKNNINIKSIYEDNTFGRFINDIEILVDDSINESVIDKNSVVLICAVNKKTIISITDKLIKKKINKNRIINLYNIII